MERNQDLLFTKSIERVLGHEGGYVHHPNDPGGETNWGITKRLALRYGYTEPMVSLTRTQAVAIYKLEFWNGTPCTALPYWCAFQLFDYSINSGHKRALRSLQTVAGVVVDGHFGRITRLAVESSDPVRLGEAYLANRLIFMKSLPTWEYFGNGWQTRIDRNRQYLKDDIHSGD